MSSGASSTMSSEVQAGETAVGFYQLAAAQPDRPAIIIPDDRRITFGQLGARVNRISHALRSLGLAAGDMVAAVVRNGAEYFELVLATNQVGMTLVPINCRLRAHEITYIIRDSGARVVVADAAAARELAPTEDPESFPAHRFVIANETVPEQADGWRPYASLGDGEPSSPPTDRTAGSIMGYTSGTTGLPKGVKRIHPPVEPEELVRAAFLPTLKPYGVTSGDGVHLVCSPVYHGAPGFHAFVFLHAGHTLVVHERFDAEAVLRDIERYRVTSSHMVPTHFHRLLQLPEEVRRSRDLSSLRQLIHAGASCPIHVKRQMLDWLGPVLWEYLGATEAARLAGVSPEEWLAKPGTVGRPEPGANIKILDETGREVPRGETGTIYFGVDKFRFEYHNDPAKTAANRIGDLATVGDLGYIDEDGYLFLLDRRVDLIVSGGVNIYPAEIEQHLIAHPAVADVAVIGRPDPEWGQSAVAVVQPAPEVTPGPSLAEELSAFCREGLGSFKCPRRFEFRSEFPRTESGKLQRHVLRDAYAEEAD